jgi:hypothetical protein
MCPLRCRSAKRRPTSPLTSRAISVRIACAVFFLRRQCILDGAQRTDLFTDLDDLAAEFLEAVKRRDLLLCFAQARWGIEGLGDGLAPDFTSQPKVVAVAGIVASGAVAARFAAPA